VLTAIVLIVDLDVSFGKGKSGNIFSKLRRSPGFFAWNWTVRLTEPPYI